jgi:hypothetical protein
VPEDGRTKRTTDEKAPIDANEWEAVRISGLSARNCDFCLIHAAVPPLLREGTARGLQPAAFYGPTTHDLRMHDATLEEHIASHVAQKGRK